MLTVVALALPLLPGAYAHGYMSQPQPRNAPFTDIDMKKNFATDNLFGLGPSYEPGAMEVPEPVCSIGGQFNQLNNPGEIVQTYEAGQWIEVKWAIVVQHGGHYSYRLCPDGRDTEECFKENELKFKNGLTWIPSKGLMGTVLTDMVQIPEDVQCDRCTLSWRWDTLTSNKGIPDAGKVRINCADIKINGRPSVYSENGMVPTTNTNGMVGTANTNGMIGTTNTNGMIGTTNTTGLILGAANPSAVSFLTLLLLAAPAVVDGF